MAVMDEIEQLARQAAQNNVNNLDVVYLGKNKYSQLMSQAIPRTSISHSQPHRPITITQVVTSVGTLAVKLFPSSPDYIQVGENAIIVVLGKLGLKW